MNGTYKTQSRIVHRDPLCPKMMYKSWSGAFPVMSTNAISWPALGWHYTLQMLRILLCYDCGRRRCPRQPCAPTYPQDQQNSPSTTTHGHLQVLSAKCGWPSPKAKYLFPNLYIYSHFDQADSPIYDQSKSSRRRCALERLTAAAMHNTGHQPPTSH